MKTKNFILSSLISLFCVNIHIYASQQSSSKTSTMPYLRANSLKIVGTTLLNGTTNINAGTSKAATNIGNSQNQTNINSGILQIGAAPNTKIINIENAFIQARDIAQVNIGTSSTSTTITAPVTIQTFTQTIDSQGALISNTTQNIQVSTNDITFGGEALNLTANTINIGSQTSNTTLYGSLVIPGLASGFLSLSTPTGDLSSQPNSPFTNFSFKSVSFTDLPSADQVISQEIANDTLNENYAVNFLVQYPTASPTTENPSANATSVYALDQVTVLDAALSFVPSSEEDRQRLDDLVVGSIANLQFVSYEYKDCPGQVHCGFIAENVAEVEPLKFAVRFNKDGEARALDYKSIFVVIFYKLLQEQNKLTEIDKNIDQELEKLEQQITSLAFLLPSST